MPKPASGTVLLLSERDSGLGTDLGLRLALFGRSDLTINGQPASAFGVPPKDREIVAELLQWQGVSHQFVQQGRGG